MFDDFLFRPQEPELQFSRKLESDIWRPDASIEKGVACLEHLITNELGGKQSRIVEVGPVDMGIKRDRKSAMEEKPPIQLLHERNSQHICAGIGPENLTPEEKAGILSDIPFIKGIFDISEQADKSGEVIEALGGRPDIVYGQHVFEDSSGSLDYLVFGPYKIFDCAARILNVGGFIVVDNYGGGKHQIGMTTTGLMVHSKTMQPYAQYVSEYFRGEPRGIFVFRKTRELSAEELANDGRSRIKSI